MKPRHYILGIDGRQPIACDMMTWAQWFETNDAARTVAKTKRDGVEVSTVFLGLTHSYNDGPPLIFETMIFKGDDSEWVNRCSTWEQAYAMHREACAIAWPTHLPVKTESEAT